MVGSPREDDLSSPPHYQNAPPNSNGLIAASDSGSSSSDLRHHDSGPKNGTRSGGWEARADNLEPASCQSNSVDDTENCLKRIKALLHCKTDVFNTGDGSKGQDGDDDPDLAAQMEELLQKALGEISAGEHERHATLIQIQELFKEFRNAHNAMQVTLNETSDTLLELGIHMAGKGLVAAAERHEQTKINKNLHAHILRYRLRAARKRARKYKRKLTARQRECEVLQQEKEASKALSSSICKDERATAIKRSAEETSTSSDLPEPPRKRQKRSVKCINCYRNDLQCDNDEVCAQCRQNGWRCERSKCPHFASGQCRRSYCTMVHEDDGFAIENLRGHCRIRKARGEQCNYHKIGKAMIEHPK